MRPSICPSIHFLSTPILYKVIGGLEPVWAAIKGEAG